MRIKTLTIRKGDNNINLGDISLYGGFIKKIEFETSDMEYTFIYQKRGRWNVGTRYRYESKQGHIPTGEFELCRDGLIYLDLNSSCTGILTFYFDTYFRQRSEAEKFREEFDQKSRTKYYSQFLDLNQDPVILEYEKLKKFNHHKTNKEMFEIFKKQSDKTFTDIDKKICINHGGDLVIEVEIDSREDCQVSVVSSDDIQLFTFEIKKGIHTYPLLLPLGAICYAKVELVFDKQCIESVKYRFEIIPNNIDQSGNYLDGSSNKFRGSNFEVVNYGVRLRICNGLVGRIRY